MIDFRRPITGATRVAAVIGDPVRHSRSPAIHNAGFAFLDLDWRYVALPVPSGRGADAVAAMRLLDLGGLSVTMPHKAAVAGAVDRLTPAAAALGVCNCVYRDGEHLVGDNTDGDGFVRSLQATPGWSPVDAVVAVVGAGGAARSIVEALGRAGAARIVVLNRTEPAAVDAARLAPQAVVGTADDIGRADIVVNTTSVGMAGGPAPDASPVDPDRLRDGQRVADIVYSPAQTPLLAAAAERGLPVMGGLPMLVHQAVAQFEHWTGVPAPLDVMLAAASG